MTRVSIAQLHIPEKFFDGCKLGDRSLISENDCRVLSRFPRNLHKCLGCHSLFRSKASRDLELQFYAAMHHAAEQSWQEMERHTPQRVTELVARIELKHVVEKMCAQAWDEMERYTPGCYEVPSASTTSEAEKGSSSALMQSPDASKLTREKRLAANLAGRRGRPVLFGAKMLALFDAVQNERETTNNASEIARRLGQSHKLQLMSNMRKIDNFPQGMREVITEMELGFEVASSIAQFPPALWYPLAEEYLLRELSDGDLRMVIYLHRHSKGTWRALLESKGFVWPKRLNDDGT